MQREQESAAEAQQIQPPEYETGALNMEADGEEVL